MRRDPRLILAVSMDLPPVEEGNEKVYLYSLQQHKGRITPYKILGLRRLVKAIDLLCH